ncbi:MAG: hypothetical protein PHU81_08340 [Acidobacteriota bacterium]|nr:hypothetical protein [Acidobacteriota bacterium]
MQKSGSFEEKHGENWLPGLTASKKNFSKREETFIARVILILFLLWGD